MMFKLIKSLVFPEKIPSTYVPEVELVKEKDISEPINTLIFLLENNPRRFRIVVEARGEFGYSPTTYTMHCIIKDTVTGIVGSFRRDRRSKRIEDKKGLCIRYEDDISYTNIKISTFSPTEDECNLLIKSFGDYFTERHNRKLSILEKGATRKRQLAYKQSKEALEFDRINVTKLLQESS